MHLSKCIFNYFYLQLSEKLPPLMGFRKSVTEINQQSCEEGDEPEIFWDGMIYFFFRYS